MSALIPRKHLFGNPDRAGFQLSPCGEKLAWLAPVEGVLNVWVGETERPVTGRPVTQDRGRGIVIYAWTYDGRHLVYLTDTDGDENYHLYAVDLDTGTHRDLTPIPGIAASLARVSRRVRDRILVAINDRDPRYHDLYEIDLASGERRLVEQNPGFAGFVTDEHYVPRLALRSHDDGASEVLRRQGENWISWFTYPAEDTRVSRPDHLDARGTTLFARDSRGRDTAAMTRIDLESGASTVIAAHDEADIGMVLSDAETFEPVAYAVNRERRRWHVLDERVRADVTFLDAAGIGDWQVASRSEDDRLWVVGTNSDTRPWRNYLYDRSAQTLHDLGSVKPELETVPLQPMQPLTLRSRDGLDLICYLTRPAGGEAPAPLVLFPHGGPWARDYFGFNPVDQWLANRGYAALTVNFRGSTGFGKAFVNAGDHEWGRRMDDDLSDAVAWAIGEGIADPERIGIMGVSYGGYATLAALTRHPDLYACGVDVVGPANLETLMATVPPYWASFRAQLVRAIGDPDTEEGRALLRERSPVHVADRIRAPLLIAQGANDPRVKQAESDQMVAALDANGIPVTYLLFSDEGHGFLRPENRLAYFARAEAFLARHLGGRAEPIDEGDEAGSSIQVLRAG